MTIPAKIGEFDPTSAVVVLTALVDDYAEVWVNGQLPRRPSYPSLATIQGFNMPNRVVLTTSAKAGDKFEIAILTSQQSTWKPALSGQRTGCA